MKILCIGDCDNGGGSYWLASAISRYTKHEAKSVRGYNSYLQYPVDVLGPNKKEVQALVKWADVVHIRDRMIKGGMLRGKPVAITFTGRLFRKCTKSVRAAHAKGWQVCVVTPDMMAFCPEVNPVWMPNPREPMPWLWHKTRAFSVCQAPTSRSAKQTEKVIKACELAGVRLDVIEDASYDECIKRKGRAWATVDQFKYGYGNNAIEGWMLGQPVISGFAPGFGYRKAMLKTCGWIPFAEARPRAPSIQAVVERLRDDPRYYAEVIEMGQEHFYAYHYAPVVAHKAVEVYEKLLSKRR